MQEQQWYKCRVQGISPLLNFLCYTYQVDLLYNDSLILQPKSDCASAAYCLQTKVQLESYWGMQFPAVAAVQP